MGLRTLMVILVKIILMEMQRAMESIMDNVKSIMMMKTLPQLKCVVNVVVAA